ncbi:TetR/AcrR family transcriptional regulator [Pseudonocardia sichuanensis]|uniref:TetR family transcriptional regulator n=1 Tax=Pseudonocardia kunmingensis TaxID=630975 RepID=A0A543E2G9_9PSEU|nr:TetR/AcrR family transcriptional regulator [Pseudonocardia kunmingensis]TQM15787.1 TetR family transcriptional regulator [Pseudonocardia kunmingensis]
MPYHHGDLRRALLDSALEAIDEHGPAAVSLRDVARRAGVSHAAPTHHFRDKAGLLTALATEGWSLLADALGEAADRGFGEVGVSYVLFATSHPAHFAVMRAPGLARGDDPELRAAMRRAEAQLQSGAERFEAGSEKPSATTPLAAWSLVHGLAALILEGAVAPEPGSDVAALARAVTGHLRPPP